MSILCSFGGAEACQGGLPRPSGSQLKLVNLQIKATDLALRFVSFVQIHNLECLGPTRRQLTCCEPVKAIAMQTSVNKLPLLDPTISCGKYSLLDPVLLSGLAVT